MRPLAPVWLLGLYIITTPAKVEQVNGVLCKALSSFVNDRAGNWDELNPLV